MDDTNAIFDILEAAEQSMKLLLNHTSPVVTNRVHSAEPVSK